MPPTRIGQGRLREAAAGREETVQRIPEPNVQPPYTLRGRTYVPHRGLRWVAFRTSRAATLGPTL